jgi:PAS domain S-box-containing protein
MRETFKNNEKFRSLLENISDGIIAIDKDWTIVYANKTAAKLLKRKPGQLMEKNVWEEFPGSVGNAFYKAYHKAMKTQKRITVEDHSHAVGKWTRSIIYPSPKGLIVYFHDVTAQRKAEQKASKNEENFRAFIDRITDGFIALDKNFNYVYVNQKIGELVHRDPASLIGKNVWKEFPEAVDSFTFKAFQTAMKEQRFISNIDYYEPLQLWQENYIYPSADGLSVFIKDISEKKLLEKKLRQQEIDRQFELMITAMEAQEKERTHIGRELHDNVNQLLVAARLIFALIRDDPDKTNIAMLNRGIENLEKAIEENRRISHELVTPDLNDESLVNQLKFLLQNTLVPNRIEVSLATPGFNERSLDEPKKLAVYRIAQEQCTNILKYAKAKKVTVKLSSDNEMFNLIIADDGIGMDEANAATPGIGLKNIAARVHFLGGNLSITTKKNKGFKLSITIPTGTTVPSHSLFQAV